MMIHPLSNPVPKRGDTGEDPHRQGGLQRRGAAVRSWGGQSSFLPTLLLAFLLAQWLSPLALQSLERKKSHLHHILPLQCNASWHRLS